MNRKKQAHGGEARGADLYDPRLSRLDIVVEGARRDDIEIVHYVPRVVAGSKNERRLTAPWRPGFSSPARRAPRSW
ncbi:hypothetical protein [Micromonospora aurantiaca (nom. illeg.)]|uniref:hypothetical protein n=1 Tax=Micromonospora aurantiaca (nom. illeg.) TaxID=47850 RepID=UPI00370949B5